MKIPFVIYCRAVGFYALLTLPSMIIAEVYWTSLLYVLTYGWFAWCAFTFLYLLLNTISFDFVPKFFALFIAVGISVAFAYQMIGVLGDAKDVWHSGFVIFPFAGVIAGWVSVCISAESIRTSCYLQEESKPVRQEL